MKLRRPTDADSAAESAKEKAKAPAMASAKDLVGKFDFVKKQKGESGKQ
jgi:hypothetical protein